VVKPQPFNNSKTSSKFLLDFARSTLLLCLKVFAISSGVKPHLLIRNSVTTPWPGGVVEGVVWVQKLGNVILDLTVTANAVGGNAVDNRNWLVITRFHIIVIIMFGEERSNYLEDAIK